MTVTFQAWPQPEFWNYSFQVSQQGQSPVMHAYTFNFLDEVLDYRPA
jgi:hypothetical protein